MSQILIDIGATPDDSLGTPLRQAFADINQMFSEVYTAGPAATNVRIANNTITTTVLNSNLILSPSGIGKIQINNAILPSIDDAYDLGSPTQRFNTVYLGTGGFDLTGNLEISGNVIAAANIIAGEYFIGNGALLTDLPTQQATSLVNGSTQVLTFTDGNVTFTINGTANTAVFSESLLTISTDTVINGNLTLDGNVEYINVTNLNVKDPIIGLGRGAHNQPLTTDDGYDRGTQLWYFDGQEQSAFFGYNNSTGNLIAASNVSVANEVVSVNNYGTLEARNVISNGNVTANYFIGNATALTGVMADRGTEPNSNWNDITNMGIYTVNRASWSGTQNTPIDSQVYVGMLEVKNSTGTTLTQTFWPGTVNSADVKLMWQRNYWNGTWTGWEKIINGSQIIDGGSNQF